MIDEEELGLWVWMEDEEEWDRTLIYTYPITFTTSTPFSAER
jgi:hypothetical protein